MVFSHNADLPVVDVNIERVLSRWWKVDAHILIRQIYELDAAILPQGRSYDWHQALMDLGSTVCTKRSPDCKSCPMQGVCRSAYKVKEKTSAKPNEKQYWGQPRRVWRGRVLKLVTDSESISRRALPPFIAKKFAIKDKTFSAFIISILDILESEGFIVRSKKGEYFLAKE
jgi:adenine-specific DNA glycosylase